MKHALSFGLGLPNGFPVGEPNLDLIRFAQRAESLGYDRLWAGDHVVFHVPRYEIFTTLATVAAHTRRISIGPGVLLLCLRNPVHVAQAIATLDHLSGGRFALGVGVGGEHPKEFEASGVTVRERGARTDEALVLLKKLWEEPNVDHDGRFWKLRGISMALRPRSPLAVWIGGRSAAALRRVVTHGDAWFPGFVTPERYCEGIATIGDLCAKAGRDPSTIGRGIFLFVGVDREPLRARRQTEEFLSRNYAMPFEPFARYVVRGAPSECADGIRRYLEAGVSHVTVRFATADPLSQLELWSGEVLPLLREV
jgi:probable F420-dependent oxidoreductase